MVRSTSSSSGRQTSLAGFMVKKPVKAEPSKVEEQAVIEVLDDEYEDGRASKRRRLSNSPLSPLREFKPEVKALEVSEDAADDFDPLADYPPKNHPSYHLPPNPAFNHPISIVPVPQPLRAMLFNTTPKSIVKPDLGLDLLYFKRFIDPTCSHALTRYLLDCLPWYRVRYTVRGININTPRFTTVFGKDSTPTRWDGYSKAKPRAIPEILLILMKKGESPPHPLYPHIPTPLLHTYTG